MGVLLFEKKKTGVVAGITRFDLVFSNVLLDLVYTIKLYQHKQHLNSGV